MIDAGDGYTVLKKKKKEEKTKFEVVQSSNYEYEILSTTSDYKKGATVIVQNIVIELDGVFICRNEDILGVKRA